MTIIHSHSNSSSFNLAAEEYLFSERQDDILFLYVNEPSVIIGSNQVIRNEVNLNFCAENNIRVVRRMSGGGAVYHDLGNLNYCFITNKTEGKSLLSADFLLPVVETLKLLNVPVEIGKRKDLWLQGGFKVSGTASHVSKNRELHHGTLLYDTDLDKLQKSLTVEDKDESLKGIASVPSVVKNLKNSLQENQESSVFFQLVIEKLLMKYAPCEINSFSEVENEKIRFLQENKYENSAWTYKK